MQAKYKPAKEAYEKLLAEKRLTPQLRADIYRQLGWMYHSLESLGEKRQRESFAIHCLQRSIEASAKSGQSLYLLGRCYASLSKVHDAFIAYRNSVEKSEGNADTWCSIGVLYQQQNQPMDALQAYICAVQLDKTHKAAWTNLGILYESCSQPRDAFACYMNATRISSTQNSGKSVGEDKLVQQSPRKPSHLQARLKFLQTQLSHAPMPSITSKRRQLPSIEEAWNVPISAEMSSRQQQSSAQATSQQRQQQYKSTTNGSVSSYNGAATGNASVIPTKRMRSGEVPVGAQPNFLTQQQLQMLHTLQQNQNTLTPPQQQLLLQLTNEYRLMQQYTKQQRVQQQQQKQPGGFVNGIVHTPESAQFPATCGSSNFTQNSPTPGSINQQDMGVTDVELQAILSHTDITTTAENLLKQFARDGSEELGAKTVKEELISGDSEVVVEGSNTVAGSGTVGEKIKITNKIKLENGTLKSTTTLKREKPKSPGLKVEKVQQDEDVQPKFNIEMDSREVNEMCK